MGQRGKRGAAYVEFLTAVFVTALGAAAILGLVVASSHATRANEYYSLASNIARQEIENIRASRGYLLANRTGAELTSASDMLDELPDGAGTLTVEDSSTLAGAKDITVTITWRNPPSTTTDTLTLKTMVSPDGPTSQ